MGISDYNEYTLGMSKSLEDKLFFLRFIEGKADKIVDYGCADGALLREIQKRTTGLSLVGYDNDENMLDFAKEKTEGITYYNDFGKCTNDLSKNSVLNLSSVIHEIYSYLNESQIQTFWNQVFNSEFKYIAIRDFCLGVALQQTSDPNDVFKIRFAGNEKCISEFEEIWGSLNQKRNLIHFLMKYRYLTNWSREIRENYFPISKDQLINLIPRSYEVAYLEHYILPFTKEKVKEDFNVTIKDNTHIKMLLKRRI